MILLIDHDGRLCRDVVVDPLDAWRLHPEAAVWYRKSYRTVLYTAFIRLIKHWVERIACIWIKPYYRFADVWVRLPLRLLVCNICNALRCRRRTRAACASEYLYKLPFSFTSLENIYLLCREIRPYKILRIAWVSPVINKILLCYVKIVRIIRRLVVSFIVLSQRFRRWKSNDPI